MYVGDGKVIVSVQQAKEMTDEAIDQASSSLDPSPSARPLTSNENDDGWMARS